MIDTILFKGFNTERGVWNSRFGGWYSRTVWFHVSIGPLIPNMMYKLINHS